jgi:hypothetical protein
MGGLDNFFGDPLIGVPLNAMHMTTNGYLHHNSMDTIEKVDPRTLREMAIINAAYLYYLADAGENELPQVARLSFDRAIKVIGETTAGEREKVLSTENASMLAHSSVQGGKRIRYYAEIQKDAVADITRIVRSGDTGKAQRIAEDYAQKIDAFTDIMIEHFEQQVTAKANEFSAEVSVDETKIEWEKEAEKLIPKRKVVGTLTLEGIHHSEWAEVTRSPRWWSANNVASASWFWCDGKRNLKEIKELVEIESEQPVKNFDLIAYYRFLEKHDYIEFVR